MGVDGVYLSGPGASGEAVLGSDIRIGIVLLWGYHAGFSSADAAEDKPGRIDLLVEVQLAGDGADKAFRVIGIVDGEVGRVSELFCFSAKDAAEDGVEGPHPDVAGFFGPNEMDDTFLHFPGRFVGEGEGQDSEGVDAFGDEISDAVGEYAGLSGAGAGDDHNGSFRMFHRKLLGFI